LKILAIDLSKTNTGFAFGSAGAKPSFGTVKFGGVTFGPDDDFRDGWRRVEAWLTAIIESFRPDAIWCEAPPRPGSFGGATNAENTLWIVGAWAALCLTAGRHSIMWREANVKSVRMEFVGSASLDSALAKKEAKRVCLQLGWKPANLDEADAGAVFYCAGLALAPSLMPSVKDFRYRRIGDDGAVSFKPPPKKTRARSRSEAVFRPIRNIRGK